MAFKIEPIDVRLTLGECRASLHLPAKHSIGISTVIHSMFFIYVYADDGPKSRKLHFELHIKFSRVQHIYEFRFWFCVLWNCASDALL